MIYFIQNAVNKAIKIGFSQDVDKRLVQLRCATPDELALIGVIPGSMSDEKALHQQFKRYRLSGEWFSPKENLLKEIGRLLEKHQSKGFHNAYWALNWEPQVFILNEIVSMAVGFHCEAAWFDVDGMKYIAGIGDFGNPRGVRKTGVRYEPHPKNYKDQMIARFCDFFDSSKDQFECFDSPIEAAQFFINLYLRWRRSQQ